jgi:hypothetical protein
MKRSAMCLTLALSLSGYVQTTPNFSGKWIGGRSMVNPVGVVGPQEMTITQDSRSITIDRPYGRNRASIVLALDGSETRLLLDLGAAPSGAQGVKRELFSRATWEGNKLKISTRFRPPGASRDVVTIETLSLDGDTLVVERSDEAMGATEAPPRGGIFQTSTLRYKRVKSIGN